MEKIQVLKSRTYAVMSIILFTFLTGCQMVEADKLTPLEIRERRIYKKKGRFLTGLTAVLFSNVAIPYYAWAHRGKRKMAVWLARFAEGG